MNQQHTPNHNKNKNRNTIHQKPIDHKKSEKQLQNVITTLFTHYQETNDELHKIFLQENNSIINSLEDYLYRSNFTKERKEKIKIKTKFKQENYKLSFIDSKEITFENLKKDLEKKYEFKTNLVYLDEENDLISIFSNEEFQISLQFFKSLKMTPKFKIIKSH